MTKDAVPLAGIAGAKANGSWDARRLEMPEHNGPWVPKVVRQTLDHYIPDAMTYNGYSDSRQVLVYFKHGEEIARSENGVRTYTPRFKELCHELVDKMFKLKENA